MGPSPVLFMDDTQPVFSSNHGYSCTDSDRFPKKIKSFWCVCMCILFFFLKSLKSDCHIPSPKLTICLWIRGNILGPGICEWLPLLLGQVILPILTIRGSSILPILSKVADRYVAEQLIAHLNSTSFILHLIQSQHSTARGNYDLQKMSRPNWTVESCWSCISKLRNVSDTVNHLRLITKLGKCHFSPNTLC